MDRLPNELVTEIFTYLDDEDIFKLPFHLISRVLSPEDVKQRWRHVYVYLERNRLEGLVRLAAKPGLRESVTKISITMQRPCRVGQDDFLKYAWNKHAGELTNRMRNRHENILVTTWTRPQSLNFENFHSSLGQTESSCHYCRNMSLKAQFSRHTSKYDAWRTWHDSKQDVSLLKVAFALLPNLQTVRIDDADEVEKIWDVNDPPFFYTEVYRHFSYWLSGKKVLERIVKAVSDSQVMKPSFRNMRNTRPSIYGRKAVYLMLGDLVLTVTHESISSTFETGFERLEVTDSYMTRAGRFYRGIIDISSIDACIPIILHNRHLPCLVQFPKDLQALTIHCGDCHPHRGPNIPQIYTYWAASLSNLDLEGFCTQASRLESFLVFVALNLQSLRLCNITLNQGTWISLFDRIGGVFDLHRLMLDDLKNSGPELTEITGSPDPVMLVLTPTAVANLFEWICGLTDVHYTRVLMCHIDMCNIDEEIRHQDEILGKHPNLEEY